MKKIGILLRDFESASGNKMYGFRSDLLAFLRKYKEIEVITIPIDFKNNEYDELERVEEVINSCNGIILPGGSNAYEIDLKIAKYLHEQNIPTLGICLGMQILSLAFDGDIAILKDNSHQSKEEYVHEVKLKRDSKIASILKKNKILVNSRHNEHITTTDLNITAIAPDMTIEAVEDQNKKFFIGIQWHPESLPNDIYSKRLFDYFINTLK